MTATARATRREHAGRARQFHHSAHPSRDASGWRGRRRVALVLGLLPLASGLMLGSAVADRAPAVVRLSSSEAAQAGQRIAITRHEDLAPGLAEVIVPAAIGATRATGTDKLLALASDAGTAAVAGQIGPEATSLLLAKADGSQVQVQLPGLIAAAFARDASWLAVIDGNGALWRVSADGAAGMVATGPFIGQPLAEADGSVVALQVPSVEAPYQSTAVRVSPAGALTSLTDEALVYGTQPLADGSLAVVAHRPSGTVVLRLSGGSATLLAELGPDAVNVAVGTAADVVAWERSGQIFRQALPAGLAERIAAGSHPRLASDAQTMLVDIPTGTQLIEADGAIVATFTSQLGFACNRECAP